MALWVPFAPSRIARAWVAGPAVAEGVRVSEQNAPDLPAPILEALAGADAALAQLDDALSQLGDGDLHRAHRDGGWTVA